jgi:hypothetical protein
VRSQIGDAIEETTVTLEVDGEPLLPLPVRVGRGNGRWAATAGLPRSTTPGKVVSLLGHGGTREDALQHLIRIATKRLTYDKESREIERLRLETARLD